MSKQQITKGKATPSQQSTSPATPDHDITQQLPSRTMCSPADVLALQRTIGNRAVNQLMAQTPRHQPVQKKENKTGLSDNLRSGIENLSGHSIDDVKVHYNSDKPAQLQAHAYGQGSEIHLDPGQEKNMPHEAWHVVQKKQGRVKPTLQLKGTININDDEALEKEADDMGVKALQLKASYSPYDHGMTQSQPNWHVGSSQLKSKKNLFQNAIVPDVVQRTPSNLAKSDNWKLPSRTAGEFLASPLAGHPGQSIIDNLAKYIKVADDDFDERSRVLYKLEIEIENFRKLHDPVMGGLTQNGIDTRIHTALGGINRSIATERAQIAHERDAIRGGHPETRHGADINDEGLVDRLLKQRDRADENAPSDTSSRFDNELQLETMLNDATTELNNAITNTQAAFAPLLAQHVLNWTNLLPEVGKPSFKAAKAAVNASYNALKAEQANNILLATAGGKGTRIPIKLFNELNLAKVDPADITNQVNTLVRSTGRGYAIKNPQAAPFGRAFELTANAKAALAAEKVKAKVSGKPIDPVWYSHEGKLPAQAAAQPQATLTVRRVGEMNLTALPVAANWTLITHYPIPAVAGKDITS